MKKRFLALMLVMAMVLGMSTTAFAEGNDPYDGKLDVEPVISKTYVVENGTAPAETFTYTFEGVSFKNNNGVTVEGATIPEIANQTIAFDDAISADTTKTVSFAIDASKYELGVYTYKVTEVAGNTTGVTYSDEELYLVLTIVRDESNAKHYVGAFHYATEGGEKSNGFTNKYDAGSLKITKTITGNSADMTKEFQFNITFTYPENTESNSAIKVTNGDKVSTVIDSDGFTQSVSLGHGESIKFENLPEGTTYVISENAENYKQSAVTGEAKDETEENNIKVTGSITGTTYVTEGEGEDAVTTKTVEEDTATYENNLTNEVDTGIFTTNMPYILALVAIAAVAVVMFRRKREF